MSKEINKLACSRGCIYAHNWTGLTTNGGCSCIRDTATRLHVRKVITAYKNRIRELENELATKAIEEELDG